MTSKFVRSALFQPQLYHAGRTGIAARTVHHVRTTQSKICPGRLASTKAISIVPGNGSILRCLARFNANIRRSVTTDGNGGTQKTDSKSAGRGKDDGGVDLKTEKGNTAKGDARSDEQEARKSRDQNADNGPRRMPGTGRGPMTWGSLAVAAIFSLVLVGYYKSEKQKQEERVVTGQQSVGKPALGGPFTLVNMYGKPVTEKSFHGKFILLYFGFCHCPDICPSELVKIGKLAEKLEDKLGKDMIKPVFISVDPDRDSLAQLRHYARDFHPSIEYLTGTKDQVAKAAKAYRVYFSKADEHEEGEDYLVDHSIVIYLVAPNGEFLDFYTQRTTVADCVDRTLKQVKEFKTTAA